jgi:hypothetical protein
MEYEDELNHRLEGRWMPSTRLKPLFETRPKSTKYTWFQTVEEPTLPKEPLGKYVDYSNQVFNPGDRAPVDFYIRSIDVESTLRSQFMALQKSNQAVYVPELNSDMYTIPGGTKLKELTPIKNIQSRQAPAQLEPFIFGNLTRLHIKK